MKWMHALIVMSAFCAPAFAQDGGAAAEPAADTSFEVTSQAVDYSAMLQSSGHGMSTELTPIPIANATPPMFPRPTVAERAAERAWKWLMAPGSFGSSYPPKVTLVAAVCQLLDNAMDVIHNACRIDSVRGVDVAEVRLKLGKKLRSAVGRYFHQLS